MALVPNLIYKDRGLQKCVEIGEVSKNENMIRDKWVFDIIVYLELVKHG